MTMAEELNKEKEELNDSDVGECECDCKCQDGDHAFDEKENKHCCCSENHCESSETKIENNEEPISMKASYKKKLAKKDDEISKLKNDIEHWKNEYYRSYADMANLRKDLEKDHSETVKYRIEGFVSDLLMVLDSFEHALKYEPKCEETKNFLTGFQFVHSSLLRILENEGVQVIEPKLDEKFDEKTMQAVDKVESDGEENLVKEVIVKGYKLYDHLIRPSMVKVSAHKIEEKVDENHAEDQKDKE